MNSRSPVRGRDDDFGLHAAFKRAAGPLFGKPKADCDALERAARLIGELHCDWSLTARTRGVDHAFAFEHLDAEQCLAEKGSGAHIHERRDGETKRLDDGK